MAARFFDFGSEDRSQDEPLSFKLEGQTFHAVPNIPGKLMIEFAAASQNAGDGEDADQSAAIAIIGTFFNRVLKPESAKRFNDLLESTETVITMERLGKIVEWLMTEYSGRPEEQPEVS
jgi:hypothetical protein